MRGRFLKVLERIRSGFWFIPTVMACMAVAMALVSVTVEARYLAVSELCSEQV